MHLVGQRETTRVRMFGFIARRGVDVMRPLRSLTDIYNHGDIQLSKDVSEKPRQRTCTISTEYVPPNSLDHASSDTSPDFTGTVQLMPKCDLLPNLPHTGRLCIAKDSHHAQHKD